MAYTGVNQYLAESARRVPATTSGTPGACSPSSRPPAGFFTAMIERDPELLNRAVVWLNAGVLCA